MGTVSRGDLMMLWYPGPEEIFAGYGLVANAGYKDFLVGLLLVDRPVPVNSGWLALVEEFFGASTLYTVTADGARAIACQMRVDPASVPLVRPPKNNGLDEAIQETLQQFLTRPPAPCLKLRWEEAIGLWASGFQGARFSLGQVVATPGALAALEEAEQTPDEYIRRHMVGNWGVLDPHDVAENERALVVGNRLVSSYRLPTAKKLWLITEWDRSVTTLLLPEEY